MRSKIFKSALIKSGLAISALLLAGGTAVAQQQVNLSAAPANAQLSDGSSVPMWGYSCGAAVGGSSATCKALNPGAAGAWSPVIITVPTGQALQINLTNNLPTPPGATAGIPTSLTIVGQIGGGLGSPTSAASPQHGPQSVTWPTANTGATNTPPPQGPRVQSFGTEVAAGQTAALTWNFLRPGTYLIESGTHPSIQGPMGLYGMLVVTGAPTASAGKETQPGIAYPGVSYDGEVPILFRTTRSMLRSIARISANTPCGRVSPAVAAILRTRMVPSIRPTARATRRRSITRRSIT